METGAGIKAKFGARLENACRFSWEFVLDAAAKLQKEN